MNQAPTPRRTSNAFVAAYFCALHLGDVKRVERDEGYGDLILRSEVRSVFDGEPSLSETGFYGLQDVRRVEQLVEDMSSSEDASIS